MTAILNTSYVSISQRFCDVLAIYIGFYGVSQLYNIAFDHQFLVLFLGIITIFQLLGEFSDFYRSWRGISFIEELIGCTKNIFASLLLCLPVGFYLFNISVSALFSCFLIAICSMILLRFGIRKLYSLFFKLFKNESDIIILGDTPKAFKLYKDLKNSEWLGSNTVGIFSFEKKCDLSKFCGCHDEAYKIITEKNIYKVYIVINQNNIKKAEELIKLLADTTCSTVVVPDLFSEEFLYTNVEDINGTATIPIIDTNLNGVNVSLKRLEDIVVGSTILLLISPLLIAIGIAIKLTSKGPVFFKQTRYGLNGKPILVYKFRTMNVMENGHKVTQAVKNDPRLTPIGGFLRKTSLDELPQFINVVFGSMSVVGPRPHAVAHNEEYRTLIPGYMLRHKVKPGITGLAQIRGWRGETDTLDKMEQRVYCDLEYIRTWSLWLDLRIIIVTIFKGFINKAAY